MLLFTLLNCTHACSLSALAWAATGVALFTNWWEEAMRLYLKYLVRRLKDEAGLTLTEYAILALVGIIFVSVVFGLIWGVSNAVEDAFRNATP